MSIFSSRRFVVCPVTIQEVRNEVPMVFLAPVKRATKWLKTKVDLRLLVKHATMPLVQGTSQAPLMVASASNAQPMLVLMSTLAHATAAPQILLPQIAVVTEQDCPLESVNVVLKIQRQAVKICKPVDAVIRAFFYPAMTHSVLPALKMV